MAAPTDSGTIKEVADAQGVGEITGSLDANAVIPVETPAGDIGYVKPALLGAGAGDMLAATYDPQTIAADAFDRTNHTGVDGRSINPQAGAAYTLALTDQAPAFVTMSSAAANVVTIPDNATVAFPVGAQIDAVQIGVGATSITAAAGVTLNNVVAGSGQIIAQFSPATMIQIATDNWIVFGNIGAVS